MDLLYSFFTLFGCSAVWLLPTALTAAALVDMVRVRAEWYWCFLIFGIPVFGSLAYFAVNYLPIFGGSQAISTLSPIAYRRTQARRRLKELQIQLQHWRGPAVLAEAGTHFLMLGKLKLAEEHLREAKEAGADVKDVNFSFAQVLQVKGQRWREALPLLEELVELEPDARFGSARLALARCLDECGEKERAEEELRAVLKRREPPEGKVRLARILLAGGEGREATELLAEVRADAATLPKYLVKEHKPWIRMARRLKSKDAKLPAPKLEGMPAKRSPAFLVAVAAGLMLVLLILVAWVGTVIAPIVKSMGSMQGYQDLWNQTEQVRQRLFATDRSHPAQADPDEVETVRQAMPGFLAVRGAMAEACTDIETAGAEHRAASQQVLEANDLGAALGTIDHGLAWEVSQLELKRAFADALESQGYSREEFQRMASMADGALLQRRGPLVLRLPEHFRADYLLALFSVDQPLPPRSEPGWRKNVEAEIEKARAKLDSFRDLADVGLPEEIRQLLESHRAALESPMSAECLEHLLRSLDPQLEEYGYEDY